MVLLEAASKTHCDVLEVAMPEPTRTPHRNGARSVMRLRELVTDRDVRILMSIAEFRLLSTIQIRALHFTAHASEGASVRAVWRVLQRLEDAHLIHRVGRQRRFPTGGSTPVTWALDASGERLTRFIGEGNDAPRRRNLLPVGEHYHHTLAVADRYLDLVWAHRAGLVELVEARGEPAAWRTHPGQLGRAITLKPDLTLITQTPDYRDHWFVEIDLGNQPVPRLLRKCHAYEAYRASGIEQQRIGVFPRVLWVLPDERRSARLRQAIAADDRLKRGMFLITVPKHLVEAIRTGNSPLQAQERSRL